MPIRGYVLVRMSVSAWVYTEGVWVSSGVSVCAVGTEVMETLVSSQPSESSSFSLMVISVVPAGETWTGSAPFL